MTFFSKTNLHSFFWAIIGAAVLGVFGLLWNWWQGPSEVIVVNKNNSKDTSITIIRLQADSSYAKEISKLVSQQNQRPKIISSTKADKKSLLVDNSKELASKYQKTIDSIFLASLNSNFSKLNDTSKGLVTLPSSPTLYTAKLKRPKFIMPSIVTGYVRGSINAYAKITVDKLTIKRDDFVTINIDLFNPTLVNDITPFFVEITQKTGQNSVYQIFSEQYDIKSKTSKISFSSDFRPNTYTISVGFYLTSEVNNKFPPFYHKTFTLTIVE